jgi:2-dehydro-3-deoxy-D-arabinonate dehydratase
MKLYRTTEGPVAEQNGQFIKVRSNGWDDLVRRDDLARHLRDRVADGEKLEAFPRPLPPIGDQEVWAAGVTYWRSREARMEESKDAGGGTFYDKVYAAERPELFFKATPRRVVGPGQHVRIRRDSKWNVPEPELTLLLSATGKITGYTIGNDMSSRDIEGENPLYLPQAKCYDGSCAIGPCLWVTDEPIAKETKILLHIRRGGREMFNGETSVAQIKRELPSLAAYLYRESSFPNGCLLMTGTGIVPPDSFTLGSGDEIAITIEPIGTLLNTVE